MPEGIRRKEEGRSLVSAQASHSGGDVELYKMTSVEDNRSDACGGEEQTTN